MSNEIEERVKNLEKIITVLTKDNSLNASKVQDLDGGLKKIIKELEKMEILAKELGRGESEGSSAGGGANLSDAQIQIAIRKVLLDDKELGETFKKIIGNVVTFNQEKAMMNGHIDEKNSKKKKSKIPFISIAMGAIVLIFGIVFVFLNEKPTKITILAGEKFYDSKNLAQTLPSGMEFKITNEDDSRYFFKIDKKEYYIPKKSPEKIEKVAKPAQ
ncbi:MAG: hypothetical protein PHO62_07970 [Sulfurimonas sp.]|uniref:hypothetical protein n=1 Tax=Sulfurimonas sp. TaxID=2022749 RepID=UPI00260C27EB|nr:hypothetical protein [Sulfurimonas sp.]MDD5373344.1 hypothetical protein [Sulfurimonas sp.]